MGRVWIPERLYRMFPWVSIGAGLFFYVYVQGFVSLALCTALVVYGLAVKLSRAVGGW